MVCFILLGCLGADFGVDFWRGGEWVFFYSWFYLCGVSCTGFVHGLYAWTLCMGFVHGLYAWTLCTGFMHEFYTGAE